MENKYQEKVDKEINEVVNPIRNNWDQFTEKELEILLKKLGSICRDETSLLRKNILSDITLVKALVEIGERYSNNSKILIEIVSSINNMNKRYDLEITDETFHFLIDKTKNKKVNFYISIFIAELSQFTKYGSKWEYIMSIPNIAPKEKSINTFYRIISNNIDEIPANYKSDVVKIFEKTLNSSNLHEVTINKYLKIISDLR
ncbi:hypothetical protein [Flavobacterium lipolyticum]|uniref:Uncharacterized protein n=1 Tax=Flavobacterium lipolyticum TaxID=2893754 RepID=A0ABS8M754_9FLAO|nr:hypothetical protein [Flavobacterium sp. F-126]MCC9020630.1 hypothetical protein [Flavobacterium sp. F-126]